MIKTRICAGIGTLILAGLTLAACGTTATAPATRAPAPVISQAIPAGVKAPAPKSCTFDGGGTIASGTRGTTTEGTTWKCRNGTLTLVLRPAPVPTVTVTAAPARPARVPAAAPAYSNATSVVDQFYQDITDRDYPGAWALGGRYIGGSDYASWAAGYATTASITLGTASYFSSGQVDVDIYATQTDGTVRTYSGTYYVSGGAITSASIVQVS